MRRAIYTLLTATFVAAMPLSAQNAAPVLNFDSAANPLALPDDIYLGEVGGVATNSRGDIFVYTRTGHPTVSMATARPFVHGGSRLFQFDRNGKFTREIGQGVYGFLFAAQVRVDPQDNLWVVDEMSAMVMKFDPQGRVAFLLGRKAEAIQNPPRAGGPGGGGGEGGGGRGGGPPGAGPQQDLFNRPTDVAWDGAGNIYVSDGLGTNSRIAKFDKNGVFVKAWGTRGNAPGQFAGPHGIATDRSGKVYVADRTNHRIQIFDGDGAFLDQWPGLRQANDIVISADQHVWVADGTNAKVLEYDQNGKLLYSWGTYGTFPGAFWELHQMSIDSEGNLYGADSFGGRVQKFRPRPGADRSKLIITR
jgi:sugar lactone lactonase YvrE